MSDLGQSGGRADHTQMRWPWQRKRYVIRWRHRTWDGSDYPVAGGGECWGRTRREALRNYFNPFGVMGHTSDLYTLQAEFNKGNIEILSMTRRPHPTLGG